MIALYGGLLKRGRLENPMKRTFSIKEMQYGRSCDRSYQRNPTGSVYSSSAF